MNLMVDFDAYNAIKDVQEKYTVTKVSRNNNRLLCKLTSIATLLSLATFDGDYFIKFAVLTFVIVFSTFSLNMLFYLLYGDLYKEDSKRNLERLVLLLNTVNVNTSYDLLEESECYYRKYKFKFNKDKILQVLESKYILVPVYGINGDTKKISILQEHVVGSKEYVLSMGSPKKAFVPVLSHSS